jgi:hypothetical protein
MKVIINKDYKYLKEQEILKLLKEAKSDCNCHHLIRKAYNTGQRNLLIWIKAIFKASKGKD